MARPVKKEHRISQMMSCYQKDIDFFDDHKGNMTLSAYLIEAGYRYAGDTTRDEKRIQEIKELKQKIQELEKKVGFQEAIINRLSNKPVKGSQTSLDDSLDTWWANNKEGIKSAYNRKFEPNWERLFCSAKNEYPGIQWNGPKEVKEFVLNKLRY